MSLSPDITFLSCDDNYCKTHPKSFTFKPVIVRIVYKHCVFCIYLTYKLLNPMLRNEKGFFAFLVDLITKNEFLW